MYSVHLKMYSVHLVFYIQCTWAGHTYGNDLKFPDDAGRSGFEARTINIFESCQPQYEGLSIWRWQLVRAKSNTPCTLKGKAI